MTLHLVSDNCIPPMQCSYEQLVTSYVSLIAANQREHGGEVFSCSQETLDLMLQLTEVSGGLFFQRNFSWCFEMLPMKISNRVAVVKKGQYQLSDSVIVFLNRPCYLFLPRAKQPFCICCCCFVMFFFLCFIYPNYRPFSIGNESTRLPLRLALK